MKRLVILLPVLLAFQVGVQPALAWTWPVEGPVLRPFILGENPYAGGQHRGIDIGAPTGTSVRAPARGTVSFAGTVPTGGRTLTIRTSDGYSVTLLHLGTIGAVRGASVSEGDPVGTVGPSGVPELPEPYVYLGIRVTSDPNGYVDPVKFLPAASAPAPAPAPAPALAPAPAKDSPPTAATTPPGETQPVGNAHPAAAPQVEAPVPSGSAHRRLAPRNRVHPPVDRAVTAVVSVQQRPTRSVIAPASWPAASARPSGSEARGIQAGPAKAVTPRGHGYEWTWIPLPVLAAAALAAVLGLRRQLADAGAADAAPAVFLEGVLLPAEDAGHLRLGEQDGLVLDGDLEGILLAQAEALPDLDRNDDPAELVDVSDDACARRSPRCAGRRPDRLSSSHGLRPRYPTIRIHA